MGNIFNLSIISSMLISAVPALFAITIHELSHGYAAYKLGDNTARDMGRLTLNPIKHIDILGLIMILTIGFGWAKPVPVNMNNFSKPKWGMAVTAFAGPFSNLVLALVTALIFMALDGPYGGKLIFDNWFFINYYDLPLVTQIMHRMILINVYLAVFNLLPIPPLDGSKVVFSLLPDRTYRTLMHYERFGMIFLIIFVFAGNFIEFDLFGILVQRPAFSLMNHIAQFAHSVVSVFV